MQKRSSTSRWPSTWPLPTGGGFSCLIVDQRPGAATVEVSGQGAFDTFKHEPGGHRWQRIPPNDKRGRVQTSTVTVAVLRGSGPDQRVTLDRKEVDQTLFRRSKGPGGQHANKSATAVRLVHRPTGLKVECCTERSQKMNKASAWRLLAARVADQVGKEASAKAAKHRRGQVGSGMRGDKVRTYVVRRSMVTDHRSGRRARLTDVRKGMLDGLHPE